MPQSRPPSSCFPQKQGDDCPPQPYGRPIEEWGRPSWVRHLMRSTGLTLNCGCNGKQNCQPPENPSRAEAKEPFLIIDQVHSPVLISPFCLVLHTSIPYRPDCSCASTYRI